MSRGYKIAVVFCIMALGFIPNLLGQNANPKEILWTADWSPNGKYIAVGGNVGALIIYNAKNLNIYKSIPVGNSITRVKWHPSKNIVAVSVQMSGSKSFILNLDTNEKIDLNDLTPDGARGLDWNYTGEFLGIGDNEGQVWIYDAQGNLVRRFANASVDNKSVLALAWHPKKNILTTVSNDIRIFGMDGKLIQVIKHREEDVILLCVAWHNSGDFFVTGDYGDEKNKSLLQFWNEQGVLLKTVDISKAEYRNLAWNKQGDKLVTASDALRIFDKTGNLLFEGSSSDLLWGVSWNSKGTRIVTSSMKQVITLWSAKAKRRKTLNPS